MGKIAFAGPWYGEFGWEIMTWQFYLRKLSHDYDKMYVSTFDGIEALYSGFHCEVEFLPHNHPGRAQDWRDLEIIEFTIPDEVTDHIKPIKQYKTDGEYVRYGTSKDRSLEILFHARGIPGCAFKNWGPDKWAEVASAFPKGASIGTDADLHIPGTEDKRGIPLQELMDLMAGAQVVVGQSSGVMHLASLCGTRHVVWADSKTYFGRPLEMRYRQDWNPLETTVTWVDTEAWDPEPDEVQKAILYGSSASRPTDNILKHLKSATESSRYIVSVAYIGTKDEKETIESFCEAVQFPNDRLVTALEQMKGNLDQIVNESGIESRGEAGGAWRLTPSN